MAADLQQLIDGLSAKAQVLTDRYALVVNQRDRALEANRKLRQALLDSQAEAAGVRRQLELLRVTSSLTPGDADISATRTLLSDMLREIDKCINELTN